MGLAQSGPRRPRIAPSSTSIHPSLSPSHFWTAGDQPYELTVRLAGLGYLLVFWYAVERGKDPGWASACAWFAPGSGLERGTGLELRAGVGYWAAGCGARTPPPRATSRCRSLVSRWRRSIARRNSRRASQACSRFAPVPDADAKLDKPGLKRAGSKPLASRCQRPSRTDATGAGRAQNRARASGRPSKVPTSTCRPTIAARRLALPTQRAAPSGVRSIFGPAAPRRQHQFSPKTVVELAVPTRIGPSARQVDDAWWDHAAKIRRLAIAHGAPGTRRVALSATSQ